MYYSVLYEENQKGYLLSTFNNKIQALELVKFILDDFSENDYLMTNKTFIIEDKMKIYKSYNLISHKKNIVSADDFKVLYKVELDNSFLYHIETSSEFLDLENLPRSQDNIIQFISRNLDEEVKISLN